MLKTMTFFAVLAVAPAALAQTAEAEPAPKAAHEHTTDDLLWDDPERQMGEMAKGAVDVCETVTAPLTLVPGIGEIASATLDWICLLPAAFAIDYLGAYHAGASSFVWQPLLGLLIAKAWRGIVLVAGVAAGVGVGLLGLAPALGVLAATAPEYTLVAITGYLTFIGGLVIVTRWLQKRGSSFLFEKTYFGLSRRLNSEAERLDAQEEAWVKHPPGPFFRAYTLMAAAAGAEPKGGLVTAIPVAGPLFRAPAKADAIEAAMLRVGEKTLHETPQHPEAMRASAVVTSWVEGGLGAGGQALLVAGGALFATGTVLAAIAWGQNQDLGEYATIVLGLGGTGIVVAGGGVVLILAREVPRLLRNLLVPAGFGYLPPASEEERDVE
jgi:hypothetical protein